MYFIKKNWGLLLCGLIFVAIVVVIVVRVMGDRRKFNEAEASRTTAENWFKQVNSDGWKILGSKDNRLENAEMARYNKDVAVGHYTDIHRRLLENFSFTPQLPNTSSEAQDWLSEKVDELTDYAILQNKISWFETSVGGRFVGLAEQDSPIPESDFPAVFRQLMIYEKLVRHLAGAGIKIVNDLYFPRWLATEDAGEYTVTPVVMVVQGDAPTLQKLVNNLVSDPTMLFFVRNMKFTALSEDSLDEEFTDVVRERFDARAARAQARLGGTRGGGERASRSSRSSRGGGEEAMDGGRRSSRRSERVSRGGGEGGGMGGGNVSEADMVYEEPKRRDFLMLRTPRQIELELNLDLMEYKPVDEGEDTSEGDED